MSVVRGVAGRLWARLRHFWILQKIRARLLRRRVHYVGKELHYVVSVMVALIAYVVWAFPDFRPFPQMTTWFMYKVMGLLNYAVLPYQNNLVIRGFDPVAISAECSGIVIMLAFVFTIQIIPGFTIFQKVTALLLAPVIYAGNLVRVLISLLTGLNGGVPAMIFVHDTFGQLFVFFWAILVYFVWLRMHALFPADTYANKMHHRWHEKTK